MASGCWAPRQQHPNMAVATQPLAQWLYHSTFSVSMREAAWLLSSFTRSTKQCLLRVSHDVKRLCSHQSAISFSMREAARLLGFFTSSAVAGPPSSQTMCARRCIFAFLLSMETCTCSIKQLKGRSRPCVCVGGLQHTTRLYIRMNLHHRSLPTLPTYQKHTWALCAQSRLPSLPQQVSNPFTWVSLKVWGVTSLYVSPYTSSQSIQRCVITLCHHI